MSSSSTIVNLERSVGNVLFFGQVMAVIANRFQISKAIRVKAETFTHMMPHCGRLWLAGLRSLPDTYAVVMVPGTLELNMAHRT
jgi:hypothetical protein